MKTSHFTDSQIMAILKQAKYGDMDTSIASRIKELELENARLKKMYAAVQFQADVLIADWLLRRTQNQRNYGFGFCSFYFRNFKGFTRNHKWAYRIYREL